MKSRSIGIAWSGKLSANAFISLSFGSRDLPALNSYFSSKQRRESKREFCSLNLSLKNSSWVAYSTLHYLDCSFSLDSKLLQFTMEACDGELLNFLEDNSQTFFDVFLTDETLKCQTLPGRGFWNPWETWLFDSLEGRVGWRMSKQVFHDCLKTFRDLLKI